MSEITIAPEELTVADTYLRLNSIEETARALNISVLAVTHTIDRPHVSRYMTAILMDRGYRNSSKLHSLLDKIIESKLAEAEESGQFSNKDLLDVIALVHKMKVDEAKTSQNTPSVAIQVNNNNYSKLVEDLLSANSKHPRID